MFSIRGSLAATSRRWRRPARSTRTFVAGGGNGREARVRDRISVSVAASLLDETSTQALVDGAIAETGASEPGDAGRVIGHIMKSHKDEVDGALVNQLVRQKLSG